MSVEQAIDTLLDADRDSLIDIKDHVEELIESLTQKIQPLPIAEIEGCDQIINDQITNVSDSCDEDYSVLHYEYIDIKRIIELENNGCKYQIDLRFSGGGSDIDNEYYFTFSVKLWKDINKYSGVYKLKEITFNPIGELNEIFFDGKKTNAKIRECIIQMTTGMYEYDGEIAKAIEKCKDDFLKE